MSETESDILLHLKILDMNKNPIHLSINYYPLFKLNNNINSKLIFYNPKKCSSIVLETKLRFSLKIKFYI